MRDAHAIRLDLLGPLRCRLGRAEVDVPGIGARALLAVLGLHAGRTVTADRLVDALWEGELPANPANALQLRVSKLRRMLGDAIVTDEHGYRLDGDPTAVDVHRFRMLAERGRPHDALSLWRGPALQEFATMRWAAPAARGLEEERLVVLETRIDVDLDRGRHRPLVGELERLVAEHPSRERFRAQLMVALYRSGRQADALGVYQDASSHLADEFGMDPGPELQALQAAVLTQDRGLDAPPDPQPAALPVPFAPLVGRHHERPRCLELLDEHRMVTITGPGGAGKTALAVDLVAELARSHPDGAWWVHLADLDQPERLVQRIADTLGISDAGDRPVAELLLAHLRRRQGVLVLDNCEHLADAVARLAQRLLGVAAGLRILATSRRTVGIAGEAQLLLSGLEPDAARRLFVQRARAAGPSVELGQEAMPAVEEICDRVDRLPLAIELIAVRTRSMSLGELADRLDDAFALHIAGPRAAQARHRTLEATIGWSHELLNPDEAVLFRRLAVFAGSWALADAEAVCPDEMLGVHRILDALDGLVEQSLVVARNGRYRLLQTVRAYAADRLHEAREHDRLHAAFTRHFRDVAIGAEEGLRGPEQARWIRRLRADDANIHAVLAWERDHAQDHPDETLLVTAGLAWFWFAGRHGDGRQALRRALDAVVDPSPHARARALQARSIVERPGGCIVHPSPLAEALAAESLALFRSVGDTRRAALSVVMCAVAAVGGEQVERWRSDLAAARAELYALGDRWGVALADFVEMDIHVNQGSINQAMPRAASARDGFSTIGDRWGVSAVDLHLGEGLRLAGRSEQARLVLQRSVEDADAVGLRNVVAGALIELAFVELDLGDHTASAAVTDRARGLAEDLGNVMLTGMADVAEASRALLAGEVVHAMQLVDGVLAVLEEEGATSRLAEALAVASSCAEGIGELARAAQQARDALEAAMAIRSPGLEARALEVLALAGHGDDQHAASLLARAERLRHDAERPRRAVEAADVRRTLDRLGPAAGQASGLV